MVNPEGVTDHIWQVLSPLTTKFVKNEGNIPKRMTGIDPAPSPAPTRGGESWGRAFLSPLTLISPSHSTLQTPHSTLHTPHSTLPFNSHFFMLVLGIFEKNDYICELKNRKAFRKIGCAQNGAEVWTNQKNKSK